MWQAEHVRDRLQALYPQCDVSILGMTTRGDQILDRSLSKVGGKGLFVKELELALLDGRADLAVHSLKDVPMQLDAEFALTAIMAREDPHDALVSARYDSLDAMPAGAVVGTSSLRRGVTLKARYPHLRIESLRGNLDTRLGKLDRGEYDAIVLACAGLRRLGLADRIRAVLPVGVSLPAAGQGALGIETRAGDASVQAALMALHDPATAACVLAERAVSRALGGSCQTPLAAFAMLEGGDIFVRAMVASLDGVTVLRAERRGPTDQAEAIGAALAQELLDQGAGPLMVQAD